MSNTRIFSRDPTITFADADIARLAQCHLKSLPDPDKKHLMEDIVYDAATAYGVSRWVREEGYDGPDTLDRIERPAAELAELLNGKNNRHYLGVRLFQAEGIEAADRLADFEAFLGTLRALAREAHRPPPTRGRPPAKYDLTEAYRALCGHWRWVFPDAPFTNVWDMNLMCPTSPAACFVFDVMDLIDPCRPRLAEELRELMAKTVKSISGPRRGRRKSRI